MHSRHIGEQSTHWSGRSNIVEPDALRRGNTHSSRIFMQSGEGAWLQDVDGQQFLDLTSAFGVSLSGHAAPHVTAAVAEQAGRLVHSMGSMYPTTPRVVLAEQLLEIFGLAGSHQVAFATSGSDAVQIALKAVFAHTQRPRLIALRRAFHGQALGALGLTGQDAIRQPFEAILPGNVDYVDFIEPGQDSTAVLAQIETLMAAGQHGGVVFEPAQGMGGHRYMCPDFAVAMAAIVRSHGGLVIADEILTGLWRAGAPLLLPEMGVDADITCIGKGLAGGLPIGATIAPRSIWSSLLNSSSPLPLHAGTFNGDPLVCHAAVANLRWLTQSDVQQSLKTLEALLAERLSRLTDMPGYRIFGRGLFWGIEVAGEDAAPRIAGICRTLFQQGILLSQSGWPLANIIGLCPPVVTPPEALADALDALLAELMPVAREPSYA